MRATPSAIHPWVTADRARLRFGIEFAPPPDWGATRDFAQMAEVLGFDSRWIPDHPGMLGHATWTIVAALATATTTIRLGPLVACAAYANPVILARAAADVDRLSGGRMALGLGSGDMPHEFARLGLAWQPAAARPVQQPGVPIQAKFDRMPADRLGFFGQLPIIGSPEQVVERVRGLVAAGLQYLIVIVFDPETLRLLGEHVVPAIVAA
jgi:alkanesulfonate monooxygenase SsuD/methylene tetrahydromethanopterin reductase-like flavin-dependent oxidoreductase (luciferase family)